MGAGLRLPAATLASAPSPPPHLPRPPGISHTVVQPLDNAFTSPPHRTVVSALPRHIPLSLSIEVLHINQSPASSSASDQNTKIQRQKNMVILIPASSMPKLTAAFPLPPPQLAR